MRCWDYVCLKDLSNSFSFCDRLSRQKQVVFSCSCRVTAQQVLTRRIYRLSVNTHTHTVFFFLHLSLSPSLKINIYQQMKMHSSIQCVIVSCFCQKGNTSSQRSTEVLTEIDHRVTLLNGFLTPPAGRII